MSDANAWNEHSVLTKLASIFPPGPFVTLPQVRNGTGYSKRARTADAIVASVWPSRGLYLAGVEIKVSKSDWRKELKTPEKTVSIQRFCKYWYVAAPVGIVPVAEIPDNWGLIECNARGANITKCAPVCECEPPDLSFVCSVLRTCTEVMVSADSIADKTKAALEAGEKEGKAWSRNRVEELQRCIAIFEEASGVSLSNPWNAGSIGKAVKVVLESRHEQIRDTFHRQLASLKRAVAVLESAITTEEVSDET